MVSPNYVEGVIPCTRFAGFIFHFARGDFCHFADFELEILRETSKYFVTSMSPFLLLEVCRRVSFLVITLFFWSRWECIVFL